MHLFAIASFAHARHAPTSCSILVTFWSCVTFSKQLNSFSKLFPSMPIPLWISVNMNDGQRSSNIDLLSYVSNSFKIATLNIYAANSRPTYQLNFRPSHISFSTLISLICFLFWIEFSFTHYTTSLNEFFFFILSLRWHCFIGRNFGCFVTHDASKFIYFYIGQMGICLFATAWVMIILQLIYEFIEESLMRKSNDMIW